MKAANPKQLALLRAIQSGERYSKANRVLAPLSQAGLITIHRKPGSHSADSATLTALGESYLRIHSNE